MVGGDAILDRGGEQMLGRQAIIEHQERATIRRPIRSAIPQWVDGAPIKNAPPWM